MVYDDNARVYWQESQKVNCHFSDLFENKIYLSGIPSGAKVCGSWEWLFMKGKGKPEIDFLYNKTPQKYIDMILPKILTLVPTKKIKRKINRFVIENELDKPFTTISLRTWNRAFKRANRRITNITDTYRVIWQIDQKEKILLTCDDKDTIEKIVEKFPDRDIVYFPKESYDTERTGIQGALAELCCGSYCRKLYASYRSTFSEIQWWIGGCKAEVEVFNEYKQIRRE